ncbi:hypothetical protein BD289DRAFT_479663 [Coniella lustricola]|uniref:Uncharacterized protein n=1 Tax=Coniella lustricola TaxID=2025994 RepID=A0A2T3AI12_9PEZI|nr:hypothetical protein BD289DRAFT_479663 [Coniella lustricola]
MTDRGQYAELNTARGTNATPVLPGDSLPGSHADRMIFTEASVPTEEHVANKGNVNALPNAKIQSGESPLTSRPDHRHRFFQGWALQLASALVGILCFVALLVIATNIHGKRLSSWTLPITPNAVVSILSTVSQATIVYAASEAISQLKWIDLAKRSSKLRHLQIFDDASRGAWGSLKFFWLGRQSSVLAYVSSLIIICSLAVSPLSQQILSYPQRSTLVTGIYSSVPRSQAYDYQDKGVSGVSGVISSLRDGALEAAAISGLYDLVRSPPFACPGSNCTYPAFTTLGIASSCTDVTTTTEQFCNNNATYPELQCNYTLPGGIDGYGLNLSSYGLTSAHSGWSHTIINTTTIIPMDYDTSFNTSSPLVQIGIIMFNDSDISAANFEVSTEWESTLQATVCEFSLVAQSYSNSTSINGTIQPGSIKSWPLTSDMGGALWNMTVQDEDFPGNRIFTINYFDFEYIIQVLELFDTTTSSMSYADALYYSGDVPATMQNIATGMSYHMLSGPNATTVTGDVFAIEAYIQVNRAWIILTIILSCSSALVLIAVIVQTHKAKVRPWKSKLDPLLYGFVLPSKGEESPHTWSESHVEFLPRRQTIVEQLKR